MLTNLKRRSALLLSISLVCATVALVSPTTAGAVASKVPNAGTTTDPQSAPSAGEVQKACPGSSAAAAGFTDTTSTDVDCIKMFGITQGKTATTYDPSGTISRQDMARYIHRMFVPTGLAAAGLTAVPAFTDIAHVAADGAAAITALASHGITLGTSTTTYSPDDNVTRAQMAAFLNRFASLVKDHANTALTTNVASGHYNYTDITSTTFEEMESIIRLYNLGVMGTCTVTALGTGCDSTYRPTDNITRAEMASMLTNLLNHTNARPAGVSIQSTTANLTVGAVDTLISVRNADFSVKANALVDEFTQLHNDAAGVAAVAPFHSVLGTCTAGVSKSQGGTLCVIDSTDPSTNAYGNVAGTSQTTAAYKTANWWVHTGSSGGQYVDGTTSDTMKLSVAFGAASALANAVTATVTSSATYALATDKSGLDAITDANGINTIAGGSHTFTVTAKTATATSTAKSGYSLKITTATADHLGNVTQSLAYYPMTSGVGSAVASWTTTCPADDSALNTNYVVAIQHKIEMGALLDADGLPTGVTVSPLDDDSTLNWDQTTFGTGVSGAVDGYVGLTCDDETRVHTYGGTHVETLAVSSNNYATTTAGSLATITSTAYDQYGDGIAGVASRFMRRSVSSIGGNTDNNNVAILTSGANGTASLSAVVCAAGASVDARVSKVAWSIHDPTGNYMDAIAETVPAALTAEGTTIYCTSAGTDGAYEALAAATQTTTIVFDLDQAGWTGGTLTCTVANSTAGTSATTAAMAHGFMATVANGSGGALFEGAIEGLANVPAADIASTTSGGTNQTLTIVFPAATGTWTTSCTSTLVESATAVGMTITQGTGTPLTSYDFIDDDLSTNTIITMKKTTGASAAGAASTVRTYYQTWTYDSTDQFGLDAGGDDVATTVLGATEAQFEAENASLTALTTDMTITYRTGALTTGISYFVTGT